jgi:5-methylcytosine-specific restriction endonuclease McrA
LCCGVELRVCSKCHARKESSAFPTATSFCYPCRERKKQYYKNNIHQERASRRISRMKRYRRNRPLELKKNRDWKRRSRKKLRIYDRMYYKKFFYRDLDRRRRQGVRSQRKNKKKRYAYAKRWRSKNLVKIALAQSRRRARKNNVPINDFTESQWEIKKKMYRYRCAYCGKKKKLTQDHVIPISKHGSHTDKNIVPACGPCNSSKYTNARPFSIVVSC